MTTQSVSVVMGRICYRGHYPVPHGVGRCLLLLVTCHKDPGQDFFSLKRHPSTSDFDYLLTFLYPNRKQIIVV